MEVNSQKMNSEENSNSNVPNQMTNQTLKHPKRMDKNCLISDMDQAFSFVDNGGLNLILYLICHCK